MSFIEELKRRKVFRVAASYAVVAFIIMQLVEILFPMFNFPQWTQQFTVIIVLLGFPIAVILSWVFDKTPQGFIKTDVNETQEINGMNIKVDKRPCYLQKRNIFLLLGVVGGILIGIYSTSTISNKINSKSIAVLPFDNYSTAPEDQYFSDGITEVIIAHLAKIKDFTVISRTSVMGYKGTTKSLKDIGKELGVAHILEGSVQRAGDEIRIVSQLIETKSDKHLWAETYDEKLKSLFAVQSDIAKKIALALETEISGDVVRRIDERPTESLIAWDNYLKGIEYSYVSNRLVDIEKSQEYFDKAFQLDPNFASALAKSAYLDLQIYWLGYDHIHSRINKAKSKIEQATALSSLSPEVLEATGYYYYYAYRDYSEALKYFDQAKNLEPGNSSHIQSIGYILRRQGKIEESLVNLHRVLETSKNDASLAFQIMLTYEQSRKYKKAEEMIDVALRLFPDNHVNLMQKAWFKYYEHKNLSLLVDELMILRNKYKDVNYSITFNIADALFRNRNYNLVIDEIENIKEPFNIGQNNYTPHIFIIGRAQELMGMEMKAKVSYNTAASLLEKKLLLNPQDIRISSDLALVYAYLNRKEDAIRMIESAMIQIPIEKDYTDHGEYYDKEIEINLVLGNTNKAIKMIERSSKIFGGLSYFDLLHPKWDSSRDNVQFQSILNSLSSNL